MVYTYNTFKNKLLEINQKLSALFSAAETLPEISDHSFDEWKKNSHDIQAQILEEIVRVAVVGAIKSGKSTFVNSLFKGDYLKRGAGVITSIVTKIRRGERLRAKLCFKSWDEIQADMAGAMSLFPSSEQPSGESFDIRSEDDRAELGEALNSLNTNVLITRDTRNMNSVLLSAYLKGYERVSDIIDSGVGVHEYEGKKFGQHRMFVGDDALSVYLKDIQLEIDSGDMNNNTEIADCQGSDSPNPLHLAMIQDYLLRTHLIIYVISGRTGVRQADIKFLSIIRKMGIMDNLLFVINFDFSEHESLEDLENLVRKIREELSLIRPDPDIYVFSALFNLFQCQKQLGSKDSMRLGQWQEESEFVEFSDSETRRFSADFDHKIRKERYFLLLKNHLERLGIISSGITHWVGLNKDILARDVSSVSEIVGQLGDYQDRTARIKDMIKSTLDGAVGKLKKELKNDVDHFFDARYGDILPRVLEFIINYSVSYDNYLEADNESGFSGHLYVIFQEFKQAVDMFMAETINPEIIRFVRELEGKIRETVEASAGPYDAMVQDALEDYNHTMQGFGIAPVPVKQEKMRVPDMDSVKQIKGLHLPPAAATMNYDIRITTEAVMRLGGYRIARAFRRLFRRSAENNKEYRIFALKGGVARIKRETEKSVLSHFQNYRENMKYQYVFKVADGMADMLYDIVSDRFQGYAADLSKITELANEKQTDRGKFSRVLEDMTSRIQEINAEIHQLRETMDQEIQGDLEGVEKAC